MKVELEVDETWALISTVVAKLIEEPGLDEDDRSNLRRWRSEEMRRSGEAIRTLTDKMNGDLERLRRNQQRSLIQKHDWV